MKNFLTSPGIYIVAIIALLLILAFFYLTPGYKTSPDVPEKDRPLTWAQPVPNSKINNFYQVTENIYRGPRPTRKNLNELQSRGINTILDLEFLHTDRYKIKKTSTKFKSLHIRMVAWKIEDKAIIKALKILTDPENYPIYLHCKHGSDRTGVVIAMYRMVVQGWSREEAIKEMMGGGYGFHISWKNIPKYIEKVDVEKIKKAL